MKSINKNDFKQLFSNLCCSQCKNDFIIKGLNVIELSSDIIIANLSCSFCGKDFGKIILNYNKKSKNHSSLEVIEGPPPITSDDVINAHKFIKNL